MKMVILKSLIFSMTITLQYIHRSIDLNKHWEIKKGCPEFISLSCWGVKMFLPIYIFLSQFEFFSFVTIWGLEFCHSLRFGVLSQFEFYHNLRFGVFSQWFLSLVTIWVFEFCHNLSFGVLSQFEVWSFVTIWIFELCHNMSFWVLSHLSQGTILQSEWVTGWLREILTEWLSQCPKLW